MSKLPYGESDFQKLREQGFVYVDKTQYIEQLENDKSFVHYLRPRRFGKSLFTSMLACYYDVAQLASFSELFKGTYIYDHPTQEKNSYYILNFNFSGFTGKISTELEKEFNIKVLKSIQACASKYKFQVELLKDMSAAQILGGFISDIQTQLQGKRLYVIIDEYDHFANDLLSFQFDEFTNVMSGDGYVRGFYEELKIGTQKGIGRIFVTGVSPISLDSMTSGYNISSNLSLDARYHDMMGFTSEEVMELIKTADHIQNGEKTLLEMKQYYDGYLFSEDAKHHLFNPNMALYYLDRYQSSGKAPKEIVDRNIFSDYKKLEQLVLIKQDANHTEAIQTLLEGEHPNVVLTTQFTLNQRFDNQDFYSLLFYLGYLTIDRANDFVLTMKIPNMVMKKVFVSYFQRMLEEQLEFKADISGWQNAILSFILKNDSNLFIQEIEAILHKYPDRMFRNFKERNIQQIAEMIVGAITGVDSDMEHENDEGYCDHVIIPFNTRYARKLIEYKYLKKEYSKMELENAIADATLQIHKYMSSRHLQRYPYDAWIMIFAKDKCIYSKNIN